jgi:hypothetical protein
MFVGHTDLIDGKDDKSYKVDMLSGIIGFWG